MAGSAQSPKRRFTVSPFAVVAGLISPDAPTRWMARVFVASTTALVVVAAVSVHRYTVYKKNMALLLASSDSQAKNLNRFIARQAEEAKRRYSTYPLGSFTVELKT